MSLLAKAVGQVLIKKASTSVTSWIGTAVATGGAAAVIDPQLLELIPEHARGWVLAGIGGGVVIARHRKEIIAAYAQLRAEIKAAVAAAEKSPPADTQ